MVITSVYKPPSTPFSWPHITNPVNKPNIITGDFNSHNTHGDRNLVITYRPRKRRRTVSKSVGESTKSKKIESLISKPASKPAPSPAPTPGPLCQFCRTSEDNEVDLGPIHQKDGVTVHYYCMLLSSGLVQTTRPSDKKSLLGFTMADIEKELRRGKRLGATIGCCISHCRKAFHLSCGRKNGTMHQFFDTYSSFCAEHWSHPGLDKVTRLEKGISKICLICRMSVGKSTANEIVCPPCCKGTYFHHSCMQRYALSAGVHFFKCPLCNATKDFQKAMLLYGLYIPDRDASWEKEPNAFQELLERPVECNASLCGCPNGTKFTARSGNFKLLTCHYCGSYSSHRACAGISPKAQLLICPDCGGT
ncbi:G2/M phase-specific E3 ubiquitin-protein ligase [Elysia marginata]|uniref:G2/M phase-specific E3 ubiquitin-protein ligase n=1 Tax=Elysia marginata TaxID=1093978 RepID=A0AAV4ELK6_9GAST|nr:G2/M phase-specific E3 ubiquitin-protein ligase [Elysia marginata]